MHRDLATQIPFLMEPLHRIAPALMPLIRVSSRRSPSEVFECECRSLSASFVELRQNQSQEELELLARISHDLALRIAPGSARHTSEKPRTHCSNPLGLS